MLTLVAGPHSYPGTTPMATPSQKLPMRIPSYSYHLRGSNTSRLSNMCHNDDEGEGPSAPAIPQRQRRRRGRALHTKAGPAVPPTRTATATATAGTLL